MPNGTLTYPTGPGYANNAADLVEFRVKPLRDRDGVPRDAQHAHQPVAGRVLDRDRRHPGPAAPVPVRRQRLRPGRAVPHRPSRRARELVGSLTSATDGRPVARPGADGARRPRRRHQIEVDVPHTDWNPGRRRCGSPPASGCGTPPRGATCCRRRSPTPATPAAPGSAAIRRRSSTSPSATTSRCRRSPPAPARCSTPPGGATTTRATRSPPATSPRCTPNVDFGKLAAPRGPTTPRSRPTGADGPHPGHPLQPGPGRPVRPPLRLRRRDQRPNSCMPEYLGQLQPYAVYIPARATDGGRYGLTLLLHSLSANYNQFLGIAQPAAVRQPAPELDRHHAGVARARTSSTRGSPPPRYSKRGPTSPTATGSIRPTATSPATRWAGSGRSSSAPSSRTCSPGRSRRSATRVNSDVLASLRNLPLLMWNNARRRARQPAELRADRAAARQRSATATSSTPTSPAANPGCSPLFPEPPRAGRQRPVRARGRLPGYGAPRSQSAPRHLRRRSRPQPARTSGWTAITPTGSRTSRCATRPERTRAASRWARSMPCRTGSGSVIQPSHPLASAGLTGTLDRRQPRSADLPAQRHQPGAPAPAAPVANRIDLTATNVASVTIDPSARPRRLLCRRRHAQRRAGERHPARLPPRRARRLSASAQANA